MGYTVTGMYATGEDAIRAISNNAPPDLVIMDVTLVGRMDGIETAQQIQKEHPIPVVYLTASTDTQTFERAKITEDSEYVIKPFSDSDLRIAIEMACHKYLLSTRIKSRQKFYERIITCSGTGIIVTDHSGNIMLTNPVAESLTGFHFISTKKTKFSEMVNIIDDNGHSIENIFDTVRSDLLTRDIPGNSYLVSPEGKKIPVRGTVSALTYEDGQFGGIIFIFSQMATQKALKFL